MTGQFVACPPGRLRATGEARCLVFRKELTIHRHRGASHTRSHAIVNRIEETAVRLPRTIRGVTTRLSSSGARKPGIHHFIHSGNRMARSA